MSSHTDNLGLVDLSIVNRLEELATHNCDARIIVDDGDGVLTEYMLTNGEQTGGVMTDAKGIREGAIEMVGFWPIADLLPAREAELVDGVFVDLEGVETALRGAARLQVALERHQKSKKPLMSRLGPIEIERTYCECRVCRKGFFPLDCALGLEGETMTPGAAKMITDAVDSDSYRVASRKLAN